MNEEDDTIFIVLIFLMTGRGERLQEARDPPFVTLMSRI